MVKQRLIHAVLALGVVAAMTGCADGNKGAMPPETQTSTSPTHDQTPGLIYNKPAHTNTPVLASLGTLERSNAWYHYEFKSQDIGYRYGYINGIFSMQRTDHGVRGWYNVTLPANLRLASMVAGNGREENPYVRTVNSETVFIYAVLGQQLSIYVTDNGGLNWKTHSFKLPTTGLQLESVAQTGHSDAWLLLRSPQHGGEQRLYHVRQNGALLTQEQVRLGASDAGLPVNARGVLGFANPKNGWLLATSADGRLLEYVTVDGGSRWVSHVVKAPTEVRGYKLSRVYAPTALEHDVTFSAIYQSTNTPSARRVVVYRSTDYGAHFTGQVVDKLTDAIAKYDGNPVDFTTPEYGFSLADGRIVATTDAGATWRTLHVAKVELAAQRYPCVLGMDMLNYGAGYLLLASKDVRQTKLLFTDYSGSFSWG